MQLPLKGKTPLDFLTTSCTPSKEFVNDSAYLLGVIVIFQCNFIMTAMRWLRIKWTTSVGRRPTGGVGVGEPLSALTQAPVTDLWQTSVGTPL